jgi:RND family efflux transporter MFP subunit
MNDRSSLSRRTLILGGVGLLLLAVIVLRIVQASSPGDAAPTVEQIREQRGVPVSVAIVSRGPLTVSREFSGTVSGTREGILRARSDDEVSAVTVAVGDRVRQGQLLVRVASAGVAARVRQADAALRQAQSTADRMRPLHEAGAVSDQEWERALTQLELARADLAAARDPLQLTSPLTGTVTEVLVRPGMVPRSGDPLVRVADLSQLIVYLQVSAAEAAGIREGQPARYAAGGASGRVQRVALQADPATRLVEVQVAFPPTAGLIPGTLASVEIQVASRDDAVQAPRAAVRDGTVWVVNEQNRVTRRRVQVGLESADAVELLAGAAPGERVVVEGGSLLSDGAQVRVVSAEEG